MKKIIKYFLLNNLILLECCGSISPVLPIKKKLREPNNSAVTYTLNGGRLGDQLLSYLHAKWISFIHNIPLLYKPFSYSDQLALHFLEKSYQSNNNFLHVIEFKKNQPFIVNPKNQTLYIIPYFPESVEELQTPEPGINTNHMYGSLPQMRQEWLYFAVDWNNKDFLKEIRKTIRPINKLSLIKPPQDIISVAVHVRKNGGGYDLPLLHGINEKDYNPKQIYVDVVFPCKHPPDEYYIEQIKTIYKLFNNQSLYVFIFTDDPNPKKIAEKYRTAIDVHNIIFDYRQEPNNHYTNVLEDLFSIPNFDCLIRPDSNITIVASKLADYKVLITPAHHRWEGRKLIIDKVNVTVREDLKQTLNL